MVSVYSCILLETPARDTLRAIAVEIPDAASVDTFGVPNVVEWP
jgi:hypothetical protein